MSATTSTPSRRPLSKDRVVQAAIDLADREGLDALTMRRLGAELGVQAMSLYKHVPNKDRLLDALVEEVVGAIELPDSELAWKEAMRLRARSARQVLSRHTWALGLLESRGANGPASMRYVDAVLGCLRSAGFSVPDSAHAFWLLDNYVYGQVLHEASTSAPPTDESAVPDLSGFPHLAEMTAEARRTQFTFDGEFERGLDLILDALERTAAPGAGGR